MGLTFKRQLIYQWLFAICIAVPYLGNYELTFAVWTCTILLTLKPGYSIAILKYSACFLGIIAMALLSTRFSEVSIYYVIRDITYLLKPVLGFFLGYQICRYFYKDTFKTLVYTGYGIAIAHIAVLLFAMVFFRIGSIHEVRYYAGYFSDFEVYALIILLFHKRFGFTLPRKQFLVMAAVLGFSVFMYLARTNFIQFFILWVGMMGYLALNRRALIGLGSLVVLCLLAYGAILYINPKRNGDGFEAFLYKIKIAPTEPFKSKIDMNDYIDFNDNYRSVEINLTMRETKAQGTNAILFGRGLGSTVDLRQKVYLGDMELRYISVLHNTFMTALLKSGIVGILLLILSIVFIYRQPRSSIPINHQINLLFMGTAVFLIVSYWVLMGFYFTRDSKAIIVGLLIAYKEITRNRYNDEHRVTNQPNLNR